MGSRLGLTQVLTGASAALALICRPSPRVHLARTGRANVTCRTTLLDRAETHAVSLGRNSPPDMAIRTYDPILWLHRWLPALLRRLLPEVELEREMSASPGS